MNQRLVTIFSVLVFVLTGCASRHTTAQTISTRIVKDSIFIPWEIIWGPDNNIWLTQKNGYICRLHPGTGMLDTLYHETATVIQSEGGMLGMALHPQFPAQPYVYVVYNYLSSSLYRERVVRYTYNGSNALGSQLILLDNVVAAVNHNGSRLLIVGDKLYITTGDATTMSNAQSNTSPNGKIHRINLDGTVPADNPIPGSTIWSKGHRNPQGMVYANGFLYSSEHGPNNDDELNIIKKGRNYGWPAVEGYCNTTAELQFCNDSNVVQPLKAWTPTLAVCGLDYYNAPMFPQFAGSLLMCTLKDVHLYSLKLNTAKDSVISSTVVSAASFGRLRDICISPAGRIYLSTSNSTASGTGAKVDRIVELYDPAYTSVPEAGNSLSLKLYPNPAGNYLQGSFKGSAAQYRIITPEGKLQSSGTVNASFSISVSGLPAGNYLLILADAKGESSARQFTKK